MQKAIVNINGRIEEGIAPLERPLISAYDRGFLYGDSLYEVTKTLRQKPLFLEDHLERLQASARLGHFRFTPGFWDLLRREIPRTIQHYFKSNRIVGPDSFKSEAYCRIVLTRGMGKIGFGSHLVSGGPLMAIIVQALEEPSPELFKKGLSLRVVDRLRNDPRALAPAMKSGNYLNSILAYLEATEGSEADPSSNSFDDALLCNAEGYLTEGTTFNIFYVKCGIVVTPPLEIGILEGITRKYVLKAAREAGSRLGIQAREVLFDRTRLYEADEVFVTSSIKEVFPVTRVDDQVIGKRGSGAGPITLKLREIYQQEYRR